jgi:hypothetical protein
LVTASSSHFIFWDNQSRRAYAVPRESVELFSSAR